MYLAIEIDYEKKTSWLIIGLTNNQSHFFHLNSIRYHGSSSSIKCHVYHHVGGRRHTPVVCNESREPHTSHYTSRPVTNKPRTAEVGAISKAQNWKRGTLRALWNSSWLQKMKKLKGSLWRHEKISRKKIFNEIFEVSQCRKMWKGDWTVSGVSGISGVNWTSYTQDPESSTA